MDQLGWRAIALRAPWLPPRSEVNTWGPLLRSLAVSPDGGLYATHPSGIFFSQDGGQRWHDLTERLPGSLAPQPGRCPPVLALSPLDRRILVASQGTGLARAADGGKRWEPCGDSEDADLSHSGLPPSTYGPPGVVWVRAEHGLVSRRVLAPNADEGWERRSFSRPSGAQRAVGGLDWSAVALWLPNGQLLSPPPWWMLHHRFGLVGLLRALTGLVVWCRRHLARRTAPTPPRRVPSKVVRTLPHGGGLVSWPRLVLLPLTGVVLLHAADVPALLGHGLPTRWLPPRCDHNRWQGPVRLPRRTLAVRPTNAARRWTGHTSGLFASEAGGQPWMNGGAEVQTPVGTPGEPLLGGPWWFDFLSVGHARGLQVSRDDGRHWQRRLDQPVDALYARREPLEVAAGHPLWWQKFSPLVALAPSPWAPTALAPPYGPPRSRRQTTLSQRRHDLHRGRVWGTWFTSLLDLVAGVMIRQTLTGLFSGGSRAGHAGDGRGGRPGLSVWPWSWA